MSYLTSVACGDKNKPDVAAPTDFSEGGPPSEEVNTGDASSGQGPFAPSPPATTAASATARHPDTEPTTSAAKPLPPRPRSTTPTLAPPPPKPDSPPPGKHKF